MGLEARTQQHGVSDAIDRARNRRDTVENQRLTKLEINPTRVVVIVDRYVKLDIVLPVPDWCGAPNSVRD